MKASTFSWISRGRRVGAKGFTIVELLVATLVFSVVLLLIATAVIQFSRLYYKGVTESQVQASARNITDQISRAIQFGGGSVVTTPASVSAGSSYVFCIGDTRYSYRPFYQVSDEVTVIDTTNHRAPHALLADTVAGCNSGTTPASMTAPPAGAREMLAPRMRLAKLKVTAVGSGGTSYRVNVKIVYGDDDLLDNPTTEAAKCKAIRAGTQFCAVSELSTIVTKRVSN